MVVRLAGTRYFFAACCTSLAVPKPGAAYKLDKYNITAGRMRVFIEKTKGDVRSYVQAYTAAVARLRADPELAIAVLMKYGDVPDRAIAAQQWDLFAPIPFGESFSINTAHVAPQEAARAIAAHYQLPISSAAESQ